MRGHPGLPRFGHTEPGDTFVGSLLLLSGCRFVVCETQPTREQRIGVLTADDRRIYRAEGPLVPGDSGGPILLANPGLALGLVEKVVAGCCVSGGVGVWFEGSTIEGVLNELVGRGFILRLRLAS